MTIGGDDVSGQAFEEHRSHLRGVLAWLTTVRDELITEITIDADPQRLRRFNFAVLG